jgi:quercetin dioxygenase-like cupin family protein
MKRRFLMLALFALAIGMAAAGLAIATPGSGIVNVELGRDTQAHFAAGFDNRDIVVGELSFAPGGVSGWHSHPGKVIVAVARGSITLFHANAPGCAGTTYNAGDVWVERPGQVHEARNLGTVAAVVNATYLNVPIGTPVRIDEAQPANCV